MTADIAFWDQLAEKYARQPVASPAAFERKIEYTLARMNPASIVLDLGCGTGSLALRLATAARHVHGLDVSREMIRIAQHKAQAVGVGNVTFHVAPFDDSFRTLGEASVDGICAYSLLHLLEDRPQALRQIYWLLKPGGFFVSSTVCLGEAWLPYGPLLGVMRWLGKAPPVKIISKGVLAEEVSRAGFVELSQPDVGAKPTIAFMLASKPR